MTTPEALSLICAEIALTNNGKLIIAGIRSRPARDMVPALIDKGYLVRCTFMHPGDAVRLAR